LLFVQVIEGAGQWFGERGLVADEMIEWPAQTLTDASFAIYAKETVPLTTPPVPGRKVTSCSDGVDDGAMSCRARSGTSGYGALGLELPT
jgi:hypothetical protein